MWLTRFVNVEEYGTSVKSVSVVCCEGWLYDATKEYANSFYLCGLSLILSAIIFSPVPFRHNRIPHLTSSYHTDVTDDVT